MPQDTTHSAIPLFTPEQMEKLQEEISSRLISDYIKFNHIPVGGVPEHLFEKVMAALISGIAAAQSDVVFFGPQLVCSIVQLVVPTMFITPGIAGDLDTMMDEVLAKAEALDAATQQYAQYFAKAEAMNTAEIDSSEKAVALRKMHAAACSDYAIAVSSVFARLRNTRYPREVVYVQSIVVKRMLAAAPSLVDREQYLEVSHARNRIEKPSLPASKFQYNTNHVPSILGLDILQFLAKQTAEQSAEGCPLNDTTLAMLATMYGLSNIQVNETGEVAIDEKHVAAVSVTLKPHSKWIAAYLEKHVNWDFVPEPEWTYSATVTAQEDGSCCAVFPELNLCGEQHHGDSLTHALSNALSTMIDARMVIPKPSPKPATGETASVAPGFQQTIIEHNKCLLATEELLTESKKYAAYPAVVTDYLDGSFSIGLRDLPYPSTVDEDGGKDLIRFGDCPSFFDGAISYYFRNNLIVPEPSVARIGETMLRTSRDMAECIARHNAYFRKMNAMADSAW